MSIRREVEPEKIESLSDVLPEDIHKEKTLLELADLVIATYMSKTDLARYILSSEINTYFDDRVTPASSDIQKECKIVTAIATHPNIERVFLIEEHKYEDLRHFKMSQTAINAFLRFGGQLESASPFSPNSSLN